MQSNQGKRIKEVKKAKDRFVDPDKRIDRLVALAHELGPDFLRREIDEHERKIFDLRMALARFNVEGMK